MRPVQKIPLKVGRTNTFVRKRAGLGKMGNEVSRVGYRVFYFLRHPFQWFQPTIKRAKEKARQVAETATNEEIAKLFDAKQRIELVSEKAFLPNVLSKHTIFTESEKAKKGQVQNFIKTKTHENELNKESFAIACLLGMAVGDALGAPLEFSPVKYDNIVLREMGDLQRENGRNRFGLLTGQWTDDASMGLCLADSLLECRGFNPIDLRIRFLNWWEYGYRNAFGNENTLKRSVGLGGNIGSSFTEFKMSEYKTEYTIAGDKTVSGNGSVMRLAAVPVCYHNDIQKGMEIAGKQSKTTHQGDEAAECCRLMTFIIISFINADRSQSTPEQIKHQVLDNLQFESICYSVECLARSEQEKEDASNQNLNLADRNWNWKDPNFRYAETRANEQPGYIGSYSMDALAMALHCLWSTNTFKEALIKVVNLRGDADSVGSVTGQLAGGLYGVYEIPEKWIEYVQQWDNGDIALAAHLLFHGRDN